MASNLKAQAKKTFQLNGKNLTYYDLNTLEEQGYTQISRLPYSIRVLLESVLRQEDGFVITDEHIKALSSFGKENEKGEVPFKPSRVILQDFTGVPAVVDLASLRKAMDDVGGDLTKINPEVPVDLVIDHSVQVDSYANPESLERNMKLEFERNYERYQFLNWATKAFDNYNAVPPATGIVHQVNLEYLANVVHVREENGEQVAFPDTLVGTDSHTTMINGLGVLGWGVGGIEAEAGMLGQPSYFPIPEVIGVRLTNELPQGANATDLALRVTELLRKKGVVGKFVEFFGPGVDKLPLADRATIANMAPEYGATCGFFPVDDETLKYLRLTGRSDEHIETVETYLKQNHLFFDVNEEPNYTDVVDLDLSTVEASLSGPKRPQDLIFLSDMKKEFEKSVTAPAGNQGHGLDKSEFDKTATVNFKDGSTTEMTTGDIAIAAITSCTNTSNPYVMLGAGLLAKKAVEKGLEVPSYVKTSLAPGSKVVTGYLRDSGLQSYLDQLGFNLVGYGCTTCIGNSGPLLEEIEKAIADEDLLVTSVLSGNRNFEGRIHPLVKANYLASPPLVVAYALAGTVDIDLHSEALGQDQQGNDVFLKDIWPSIQEVADAVESVVTPELFKEEYKSVYDNNELWNQIDTTDQPLYDFDPQSTYIQNPTFFQGLSKEPSAIQPLSNLRVMGKFGDSVTTDHISPAGAIGKDTPAGQYLTANGVSPRDFNSYGSRRGNHEVMVRGTFANIRIKNQLAPGTEGGYTTYWPTGEVMPIFDAAMKYKEDGTGLVVLAGNDYGMGSSRDWAAKGTNLLGVKTVIAQSYERIHRSNLVMMGVLPLQFKEGESADTLGLDGTETIAVDLDENVQPGQTVKVTATKEDGTTVEFDVTARFDSNVEIDYYRHGGILQLVLRKKLASA
ncbi:TPA: aconitate hydratase AcnA [Staphylococcus pseudintermedius]|uniref:aconitate hydratase AcnA n=1 Tax=Staphylococcus pseudintermedius TaxID=283734 RepID=UPI000CDE632E|nr:aconitate hydratase AcnA [Staphylococcus pseudintermedius]EGQ0322447.1 aconitate hydratase AcnA [Staphylococcus pseudintermedius]EGQ0382069.1 aconitate hydratase AcnA [Staphylococcus pseudintermedius]EGQ1287487.1 aconitate hydratase AcnA [Staphylococcus pseudintermedius]EGQ1607611.1 aconitate hydratase AcnA [Staphylococcus pseudintermedius]EGQ1626999.1 aconitate hydratase AcnA [Staphylococcus pseudintermedius]